MKKGITPVIAVILLLLITISMVGFAFVWFTRISVTLQNSTATQLENTISQQSQTIRIDNVDTTNPVANKVTIRSTGTQSILNTNLRVYLNNILQSCTWDTGSLAPGSTITCTFGTACASGSRLRVTAPGGPDEVVC